MASTVIMGTELKFAVTVNPFKSIVEDTDSEVEGATKEVDAHISDDDVDFSCKFYVGSKSVVLTKAEMSKVTDDCYRAVVDTSQLAAGDILLRVEVEIPDGDIDDGKRTEILALTTDIKLVK